MRTWIALWFCLLAGTAAAQTSDAWQVPPLTAGESAPAELPNYFDARELGAGTLAVQAACQGTIAQVAPNATEAGQTAVCGCLADTARWAVRAGKRAVPTDAQLQRCLEIGASQAASPLADRFPIPTATIAQVFQSCMDEISAGSPTYRGLVCSCATDAWLVHGQDDRRFADDLVHCAAAGRYREDTGRNPTIRQFRATRVQQPANGAGATVPSPRMFIPYEGNGRGPTLCRDGMYSHSSGPGTCSHHGGVAGGRHRHR